jgi:hypothetical protein
MPNDINARMEDMNFAYVKALCAQKGYTLNKVERDNDGVDATIECKGFPATGCVSRSSKIDVQFKATHSKLRKLDNGDYRFVLEAKNYNQLVQNDRFVRLILIVLHMDSELSNWLEHSEDALKITKCAYWAIFAGQPSTGNKTTITVTIPQQNVLSPDELERLMIKVAKGETL